MPLLKKICCLLLFLLPGLYAHASHMVGAELSYTYSSGTTYTLTGKFYRDCSSAAPSPPDFIITDGNTKQSFKPSYCCARDITPVPAGQCDACGSSSCSFAFGVQEFTYTAQADVSTFSGCSLTVSWLPCCYGAPGNVSTTFTTFYLTATLNRCHRSQASPRFMYAPPVYGCLGQLIDQYQGAAAGNGNDSLSYSFVDPLTAAGTSMGYVSPFTYTHPLSYSGSNVYAAKPYGFHYDSLSGEFSFTPTKSQSSVIGMQAAEYARDAGNKVYMVASSMRVFTMVVSTCNANTPPKIYYYINNHPDTFKVCSGQELSFAVKGYDPDMGDSLTMTDYDETGGSKTYYYGKWPAVYYKWTPQNSDVRKLPYRIIFTATDKGTPVYGLGQKQIYVVVKDSLPEKVHITMTDSGCGHFIFSTSRPLDKSYRLSWTFDSVFTSNSGIFRYFNNSTGMHTVGLSVTNPSGCTKYMADTFFYDTAYHKLGKDTGICLGGSIMLHAPAAPFIKWRYNNSLSDSTITTPNATPKQTTLYQMLGKDGKGCLYTDHIKISVSSYIPKTSGNTIICAGTSKKISVSYQQNASYKWTSPAPIAGNDESDTAIVQPLQNAWYKVTVNDSGCVKKDSVLVKVDATLAEISGPLAPVCPGDVVSLSAISRNALSYDWYDAVHGTPIGLHNDKDVKLAATSGASNTYLVALKMTDSLGCLTTGIFTGKTRNFHPTVSSTMRMCVGDSVMLTATGASSYAWSGGGISSQVSQVWVRPAATTTYHVLVSDKATGCSFNDSVSVIVVARPALTTHSINACPGDAVTLTATGGSTYSWSPGKWLSDTYSPVVTAKPLSTVTYHVTMLSSQGGCTQKDSVTIHVGDCVWPGDANRDSTVTFLDMLNIGVGYGARGPARTPANATWRAWYADDWKQKTGTGINYKHLDCNGDGVINADDTAVVLKNILKTGDLKIAGGKQNWPRFYFRFTKDTFLAGDTAVAILYLGNNAGPLYPLYGAGYQVSCQVNSKMLNANLYTPLCGYFCTGSEMNWIKTEKNGMISALTVETSGRNIKNASGAIGQYVFYTKDTLNYNYSSPEKLMTFVNGVKLIDSSGKAYPVYYIGDTAFVKKPPKPKNTIHADFVSDRADCEPLVSRFKNLSTDSTAVITQYTWDFGDGSPKSHVKEPVHTYKITNGGWIQNYDVTLTAKDEYGYISAITKKKWIVLIASPQPVIGIEPVIATMDKPVIHFTVSEQTKNLQFGDTSNRYEWHFGDTLNPDQGGRSTLPDPYYTYHDTGRYTVKLVVTNHLGCTDSVISYGLFEIRQRMAVFVPNAFIPDKGHINRVFKPVISSCFGYEMRIYNRQNQLVFKTGNQDDGWDGTFAGSDAPPDVYIFIIKATNLAGQTYDIKGNVTLLR